MNDAAIAEPRAKQLDGLKPGSVVTAARADLARHLRNLDIARGWRKRAFEPYAFHRNHVRKARDAEELIALAIKEPGYGVDSGKRVTHNLYADTELLTAALAAAASEAAS